MKFLLFAMLSVVPVVVTATTTTTSTTATTSTNVTSHTSSDSVRQRRDISELPSQQYLPAGLAQDDSPAVVDIPVVDDSAYLADDGYHYKTVRRVRYRYRSRRSAHKPQERPETSFNIPAAPAGPSWIDFETTASEKPVSDSGSNSQSMSKRF